jgi:hypothetical protein
MSFSIVMSIVVSMVLSMSILALVGDGASESVDPDPVVPTVGAEGFRSMEHILGSGKLDDDQTKVEEHEVLPRFGPLGRVMTYVLLV